MQSTSDPKKLQWLVVAPLLQWLTGPVSGFFFFFLPEEFHTTPTGACLDGPLFASPATLLEETKSSKLKQ